jgi:photosystem II stability/assembly factor-like uncharacterized protein
MAQEQQSVSTAEFHSVVRSGSPWKTKIWRLAENGEFIALQLLNTSTIWIADADSTLHKTANQGESWLSFKIDVPTKSKITAIDFVNPLLGWAVTTKPADDVLDSSGLESSILITSDGGLHWHTQFTGKTLSLVRVVFVNNQEGWVVGSRLVQRKTLENDLVVLHTTDQGQHWVDVSENFTRASTGGIVEDIYSGQSSKAIILTSDGEILATEDGAHSWRPLGRVPDEPPQTSTLRIGVLQNDTIWVLGASGGREGTWSMFAVRRDQTHWLKYKVHDVLLRDAIFLSDREILACGTIASNNKVPLLGDDHRAGVILRSSDNGRSWTVIFRDSKVKSINAIAVEKGRYVWAVGDDGLILRLTDTTKTD